MFQTTNQVIWKPWCMLTSVHVDVQSLSETLHYE